MECNPRLYHYDGYCFNRSRIPAGQLALREEECLALDEKRKTDEKEKMVKAIIS